MTAGFLKTQENIFFCLILFFYLRIQAKYITHVNCEMYNQIFVVNLLFENNLKSILNT